MNFYCMYVDVPPENKKKWKNSSKVSNIGLRIQKYVKVISKPITSYVIGT